MKRSDDSTSPCRGQIVNVCDLTVLGARLYASRGQQNMCRHHWHTLKISQKFAEGLTLVSNVSTRIKTLKSSIFGFVISRYLFPSRLADTFPGRLRSEMPR